MGNSILPMKERLIEFFSRLESATAQGNAECARALIAETLNAVEDEFSGIPYKPDSGRLADGRMYPPMDDSKHAVDGNPEVVRFRTRSHNVFIRSNGAFEIQEVRGKKVVLAKVGSDGRDVWTA